MNIQINGNIQEMKPKVMGPFDGPQLVCVIIAGAIEIAGVALIKAFFPGSMVSFIIPVPLCLIPLAIGWADEILHMTLPEYYELVIQHNRNCPKFRNFAMHNYMETQEAKILKEIEQEEKASAQANGIKEKQKQKTQTPKTVIPPELTRYE